MGCEMEPEVTVTLDEYLDEQCDAGNFEEEVVHEEPEVREERFLEPEHFVIEVTEVIEVGEPVKASKWDRIRELFMENKALFLLLATGSGLIMFKAGSYFLSC